MIPDPEPGACGGVRVGSVLPCPNAERDDEQEQGRDEGISDRVSGDSRLRWHGRFPARSAVRIAWREAKEAVPF